MKAKTESSFTAAATIQAMELGPSCCRRAGADKRWQRGLAPQLLPLCNAHEDLILSEAVFGLLANLEVRQGLKGKK